MASLRKILRILFLFEKRVTSPFRLLKMLSTQQHLLQQKGCSLNRLFFLFSLFDNALEKGRRPFILSFRPPDLANQSQETYNNDIAIVLNYCALFLVYKSQSHPNVIVFATEILTPAENKIVVLDSATSCIRSLQRSHFA